MDNKEMQAQFIQWLGKKTGVKSEKELMDVIKKLQSTEGAMEQTIQEFKNEMGGEQAPPVLKAGGKFDYLDCLSKLKKGGTINCGCGAKVPKVQKAFLGSVLGAFKGASSILKGGTSLAKGAKTLSTISKVAKVGQQAIGIGKNVMGAMQPTTGVAQAPMQGVATGGQAIPSPIGQVGQPANPITGVPMATALNTRVTPGLQPMGTQVKQLGMQPMKTIAPKLIAEKGAKLKVKTVDKKSMPTMKK